MYHMVPRMRSANFVNKYGDFGTVIIDWLIDWLIFINCVTNVHAEQFQDTQYSEQLNT